MKKKQDKQDLGNRCKSCAFYHSEDGHDVGECYAHPPRSEIDDDGTCYNVRPVVEATDYPCWYFRGNQ